MWLAELDGRLCVVSAREYARVFSAAAEGPTAAIGTGVQDSSRRVNQLTIRVPKYRATDSPHEWVRPDAERCGRGTLRYESPRVWAFCATKPSSADYVLSLLTSARTRLRSTFERSGHTSTTRARSASAKSTDPAPTAPECAPLTDPIRVFSGDFCGFSSPASPVLSSRKMEFPRKKRPIYRNGRP